MSAVYKVMAEMQKTQPRRVAGNRAVMLVLGGIIITGMLMVVNAVNKPLVPVPHQLGQQDSHLSIDVPVADNSISIHHAPTMIVSLNQDQQWAIEDYGIVTENELRKLMIEKRKLAEELGAPPSVRIRIDGDQSASHLMKFHGIAQECGMSGVRVATHAHRAGER